MKKLLTAALVIVMMFALSLPAMAAITVELIKDPPGHTLIIKDDDNVLYNEKLDSSQTNGNGFNKNFEITLNDGTTINIEKGMTTDELKAAIEDQLDDTTCQHLNQTKVITGAEVALTVDKLNGNQNCYNFTITYTYDMVCDDCGVIVSSDADTIEYSENMANNLKGSVEIGDFTVSFDVKGNVQVRNLSISY